MHCLIRAILLSTLVLILSACGGGSSDSTNSTTPPSSIDSNIISNSQNYSIQELKGASVKLVNKRYTGIKSNADIDIELAQQVFLKLFGDTITEEPEIVNEAFREHLDIDGNIDTEFSCDYQGSVDYKGKLDFSDDSGSANSVTIHPVSITSQSSYTDIIYQGDGLGGLKIIAYKNPIVIESKLLNKIEASVLNLPVLSIVDELPNILIKDDASNILERIALIDTVKTTYNLLENINVAVDTQLLLEIDTDIISSTGSLSVCVNLDHFLSLGLKSISRKNLITGLVTTIDNLLNLDLCILVTEEITLNF